MIPMQKLSKGKNDYDMESAFDFCLRWDDCACIYPIKGKASKRLRFLPTEIILLVLSLTSVFVFIFSFFFNSVYHDLLLLKDNRSSLFPLMKTDFNTRCYNPRSENKFVRHLESLLRRFYFAPKFLDFSFRVILWVSKCWNICKEVASHRILILRAGSFFVCLLFVNSLNQRGLLLDVWK